MDVESKAVAESSLNQVEAICDRHLDEIQITKQEAKHRQMCLICQEQCPFYLNSMDVRTFAHDVPTQENASLNSSIVPKHQDEQRRNE